MPVGSASSRMKVIHVNAISWAGSLEWTGNYRSTHVQIILAPNQFLVYELTLANSLISMQNTRTRDICAISKEIEKGHMWHFCEVSFVHYNVLFV